MARKDLFRSQSSTPPPATTRNAAGGRAYQTSNEIALAMLACTGTFNDTYYTSGKNQLDLILNLANKCSPEWVARVAIYARTNGLMKDAPVLLVTYLFSLKSDQGRAAFQAAFPRVVNNVGQLRNFIQMLRSGVTGRKSLGTVGKKVISQMLNSMDPSRIFWQAYGANPSFADVLSLARVRPADAEHDALFGYFLGKSYDFDALPENIQQFEKFKRGDTEEVPHVPFLRLTSLNLNADQWKQVARIMSWNQLRMNLNKLGREGVFSDQAMVKYVADKLRNEKAILGGSALPFAVYNTYLNLDASLSLPMHIRNAVVDAVEISAKSAPALPGETLVLVDCSGSMQSPITGYRRGATSTMTCNMAASFFAASLLKANPDHVKVLSYDTKVYEPRHNARDSVTSLASKIGTFGGGTDCGVGIRWALAYGAKWDNIIMISDNESWMNSTRWNSRVRSGYSWGRNGGGWSPTQDSTTTAQAWTTYRRRRRGAKLYCIDIQPSVTVQTPDDHSVLNVSGISDAVFKVVAQRAETGNNWHNVIGSIALD